MKYIFATTTLVLAILPFSSHAMDVSENFDLSGTLSAVSDYRSLGVSVTRGDPALQLWTALTHKDTGFYAGLWSSTYNPTKYLKAHREDALLLGKYTSFIDDIDLDVSIGRYEYPKQSNIDLWEVYAVSNIYKLRLTFIYDFDIKGSPNSRSLSLGYTFDLPADSQLFIEYGMNDLNTDIVSANGDTRQHYASWQARLSKSALGLDWSAAYVDTDISKSECVYYIGYDDVCSSTMVLGVSKKF